MERRGTGLLIFGAMVLLGVSGAIVYWALHRDERSSVVVFHWIPGTAPLKIVGAPPWTENKGDDVAHMIDPRLLELLHENAIGGELRWISEVYVGLAGPHSGALLLRTIPQTTFAFALLDRRTMLYVEQEDFGIRFIPETPSAKGVFVTLAPDTPLTHFGVTVSNLQGAASTGITLASWW